MISYPDLVPVLQELRRMLKPNGVLRLALPDFDRTIQAYLRRDLNHFPIPDEDVRSFGGKAIVHMMWYGYTVTLFTTDFIEELLLKAGYRRVQHCAYQTTGSAFPDILELDNREDESIFVEAVK